MSLDDKVSSALGILREAKQYSPSRRPLFMFSGGKDSIVACHLATQIFDGVDMFCELSLLPDKLKTEVSGIASWFDEPVTYHEQIRMDNLKDHWLDLAPPKHWKPSNLDRIRHWVSIPRHAKKHGYELMIFGRRKEENTIPRPIYKKKALNKWQCHPIYNWTREEVFEYLHKNGIPYPSCYDHGHKHLLTVQSVAMLAYKTRESFNDYLHVWANEDINYLFSVRDVDPRVDSYLSELTVL